jgi:hypothetical protein
MFLAWWTLSRQATLGTPLENLRACLAPLGPAEEDAAV